MHVHGFLVKAFLIIANHSSSITSVAVPGRNTHAACMRPALNVSLKLVCFKSSNVIKICNGIMFMSTQDSHIFIQYATSHFTN